MPRDHKPALGKVTVLARSQQQAEDWCDARGVPPEVWFYVGRARDLDGWVGEAVGLDGADMNANAISLFLRVASGVSAGWCKALSREDFLARHMAPGRCAYDTAGDGDCQHCASRGGCVAMGGPYFVRMKYPPGTPDVAVRGFEPK